MCQLLYSQEKLMLIPSRSSLGLSGKPVVEIKKKRMYIFLFLKLFKTRLYRDDLGLRVLGVKVRAILWALLFGEC